MIKLKNAEQIAAMRQAGRITGEAILKAREAVRPGVTTKHLDDVIRAYIEKCGARPSFLGYGGFPGSACISVNEQVIHGIPSKDKVLQEGDIVKIDVGVFYHGFHGDSANTFPVGEISAEAEQLIRVTREAWKCGVDAVRPGGRVGDIGHAVQTHAEKFGYGVVRRYVGHGVGHELHEDPEVPNFGTAGRGPRLCEGMVIAIEPMINMGGPDVIELSDGWTVLTADRSISAHYEHTVALTENGVEVLTLVE